MSHWVDSMFSVHEIPWHFADTKDRTVILSDYPTREEAMAYAGHDFNVIEEPTYRKVVRVVEGVETVSYVAVKGQKIIANDKNKNMSEVLQIARDTYEVVQPKILYELTEAIMDADTTGDVKYETGGVLKDGAVLWTLARVDRPFFIKGDDSPIYPFIAASTTNDGTGGVKFSNVNTRIVCWNTFSFAAEEAAQSGREFTFRHTKNVGDKLLEAKDVLSGSVTQTETFADLGNELVEVIFTDEAIEKFVNEMLPQPNGAISERVQGNLDEARVKLTTVFDSKTIPGNLRNTGYGALQAGIEYQQHLRKWKSNASHLDRCLLNVEPLNKRLVPMIRRIAEESPVKVAVTI